LSQVLGDVGGRDDRCALSHWPGGGLQVLGVFLAALQLWFVRRNFNRLFDKDKGFTNAELMKVKDVLMTLSIEGWTLGLISVGLIVAGIVCTTVAAVA
jgi:hypothetical protein